MSTHIIRRQLLDVEMQGSESDGFALQENLLALCQGWLNPAVEEVLDRWSPADEHWTIDRIDIDVGSLQRDGLERGLVDAVTRAIEEYLRERARRDHSAGGSIPVAFAPAGTVGLAGAMQRRTEAQFLQQAFRHFLESGVLPWWASLPAGKTLEDLIRELWKAEQRPGSRPEDFARGLVEGIGSAAVRKRLVRQFSADFLDTLLAAISQEGAAAVRGILAEVSKHGIAAHTRIGFSEQVWETAFVMAMSGRRPTVETLVAEMRNVTPQGSEQPRLTLERIAQLGSGAQIRDSPVEEALLDRSHAREAGAHSAAQKPPPRRKDIEAAYRKDPYRIDLEEGVHIGCAGVVLLHPFLPRFFEGLGIAGNGKLVQPERALCLLHFLATGLRFAPEYELLLPKLLCNLPFEAPVESRIELTAAEEEEAAALLAAVVRHWDALGDTSADGLRGSFLVRPGKLGRRGSDYVLQVEARSYDILLDRLPWTLGLIQLPWMEKLLWVEWRF